MKALVLGIFSSFLSVQTGCVAQSATKGTSTVANSAAWPAPIVGWSASTGNSTRLNTPLAPGVDSLNGVGADTALNTLQLVGSVDPKRNNGRRVYWLRGKQQPAALAIAQPGSGAHENNVLQGGTGNAPVAALNGSKLTLFIEFKLVGSMMESGNPKFEEDGILMSLGDAQLRIAGRGRSGKARRLPSLRVNEKTEKGETIECVYTPQLEEELHLGQWYRMAFAWNGEEVGDKRVGVAINGVAHPVKVRGFTALPPVKVAPSAPLLIGGDRNWANVPIHLGAFAVYNQSFPQSELIKLNRSVLQDKGGEAASVKELPQHQVLTQLNKPDAWANPDAPIVVQEAKGDMLHVALTTSKYQDKPALRLKNPVALDTMVNSVNFWICQPARGKGAFSFTPLFADAEGAEIEGPSQLFFSEHSLPPNSRKAGLWFYRFVDVPRGARNFVGFKFKAEDTGAERNNDPTDAVFIKDIGLERIDYARAALYYVVGNYRDNFGDTRYNNMGARALTETSGGSAQPYVLLDNLVDQSKANRPKVLDIQVDAFDTSDRHVWTGKQTKIAAATVPELFHKITIPITQPGTYRIRGKSYDSATGEYFTTDWTKLVVLKGKAQTLKALPQSTLLDINTNKPFGRLEKNDPKQITFSFGLEALNGTSGPLTVRYAVIPYEESPTRTDAKRPVELTQTRPLNGVGPITVPYEPKRDVELVVAELLQGDKVLDREERAIGVANILDKAPAFTIASKVPTLEDLAGKGKVWKTVTIVSNPGSDRMDDLQRNISEAKKLTPDLGIELNLVRFMPMPGVYDWDALQPYFDLAAKHQCRLILYMNQKWPAEWAPVEWASDGSGQVHRAGSLYAYMVGKAVYATGEHSPKIIREFNQQLARRFLNHPGFGGYYFENEHLDIQWERHPSTRSYHEHYRQGFAQFAKRRYGTIAKLNEAYGTSYTSFDQVRLPDAENQAEFPKKVTFLDFRLFQREEVEKFVLNDQFNIARAEDPRRPIIVYGIGEESFGFLNHIAKGGGIIANGGVHSNIETDAGYETVNAVPGLQYRMEPHDVTNYDPVPYGFDEMIYGMLAVGGRGMHAHIFLHGWKTFNLEEAMKPGQRTGFDKLLNAEPMMRELRDTVKLHDPIGIMSLRSHGGYEGGIWAFHGASYGLTHYNPKTVMPEGNLNYLDGSKLIAIARNTIDSEQLAYLTKFVRDGGHLVMEWNAARFALATPDAPGQNVLLQTLGVDFFKEGAKLPGVEIEHDVYEVGKGQVLVARGAPLPEQWEKAMPSLVKWAGITERLADTPDRFMQMHVLQGNGAHYLATTHRGQNQGFPGGPGTWEGKVQFLKPLPAGRYRVTEMMSGKAVGEFTPAQLAAGFEAGKYEELQMKIFKIAPL
jgi:hypothetical protein